MFFVKEARSPSFVSWHQDANYVGLQPNGMVIAWIALIPSKARNGAMRVIPRTHRQKFEYKETFGAGNLLSRGQEAGVEENGREAVMMTLNPGQFSLHNTLLVHGSDPNPSDDRQIGFVARFIPTHVRQVSCLPDRALLVRGEDTYHHFELERAPMGDLTLGGRAYHRQIAERSKAVLFQKTEKSAELSAIGRSA